MPVPDLLPVLWREAEARFGRSLLPDAKLPVAAWVQDLHAAQGSERGERGDEIVSDSMGGVFAGGEFTGSIPRYPDAILPIAVMIPNANEGR
jgi:hypothetical protein